MRVDNFNNTSFNFKGKTANFQKNFAKTFAKIDGIGEGASITFDFLGKAIVVPAVIMLSSKEPKEKKEYSAFKNPVAAVLQLALEVPILFFGSAAIDKSANKGLFDTENSKRYNENFHKDVFVSELKDTFSKDATTTKDISGTLDTIDKKGLTRKSMEFFEDLVKNAQNNKALGEKFASYKEAHTNLYHLKNRLCFAFAIALTPLICYLENKFHPIIMDKIYEEEHKIEAKKHPKKPLMPSVSIENFINKIQNGGKL